MTSRLVRVTVAGLLLAGAAACGLPGGGIGSPCNAPTDDEPTTFNVGSGDPNNPDVIRGCIDSASDVDTIDLNDQGIGTGTINIKCFGATGLVEFDSPATSAFVACVPGGTASYNHQADVSDDLIVRAQSGSSGGEYRIELLVA